MKRAKILLMSIAVLATVGTALAFNVSKKGNSAYCVLKTKSNPGVGQGVCPNLIDGFEAESGVTEYYYTTLTSIDCEHQGNCTNQASSFKD
jgi:hypothetical protein